MAKRALVIGGSGGIGAALVAALKEGGAEVATLSRRRDGLEITDPGNVAAQFDRLTGPFDTVLIATGILAPAGRRPEKALQAIEAEDMAKTLAVNAIGPALILREIPRLLPREAPSRVGILSARVGSIGDNRIGGWYSYRASKAAVNQITRGAAIEIGRKFKQTAIVALHPGTVETPFTAEYPAHRKSTPEDAARDLIGVLWRLSPAQSGGFYDYAGQEVPW